MAFTGQHTPETRRRISESNRRTWDDPELCTAHRAKVSEAVRAAMVNAEVRAKLSAAAKVTWAKRRAEKERRMITNIVIVPVAKGWVLRCDQYAIGPLNSFREAQQRMRSLLGPEAFDQRFPVMAAILRGETTDRPYRGGQGRPVGHSASTQIAS